MVAAAQPRTAKPIPERQIRYLLMLGVEFNVAPRAQQPACQRAREPSPARSQSSVDRSSGRRQNNFTYRIHKRFAAWANGSIQTAQPCTSFAPLIPAYQ